MSWQFPGKPSRENFGVHVDDLSNAALFFMDHYSEDGVLIIGVGKGISIRELANLIADVVGNKGEIMQGVSKPDRVPSK